MKNYIDTFYVFVGDKEHKFTIYESNGVYTAQTDNSEYVVKSKKLKSLQEQATNELIKSKGDIHEG